MVLARTSSEQQGMVKQFMSPGAGADVAPAPKPRSRNPRTEARSGALALGMKEAGLRPPARAVPRFRAAQLVPACLAALAWEWAQLVLVWGIPKSAAIRVTASKD